MCLPSPWALLTCLCLTNTHIFFRCGSFLKMPVASRMEISLLFRRLEWAAGELRRWLQSAWYSPSPEPNPSASKVPAAGEKAE